MTSCHNFGPTYHTGIIKEWDRSTKFRQHIPLIRSVAISPYALCGFSNPASIGVQIGALSFMAPSRRGHISEVAVRAFIAGSAACFLTACVAGTLIVDPDHLTTLETETPA